MPQPLLLSTPRTSSTARSTRSRTPSPGRRGGRSTPCSVPSTSSCSASSATSRAPWCAASDKRRPTTGPMPTPPTTPTARRCRTRSRPVVARPGPVRGARLERGDKPGPGGRRPDGRLRRRRGACGRPRDDPHRRPRHVPVRVGERDDPAPAGAPGKGPTEMGPAEVEARYGIPPSAVPDFIALRGDPSDGLPGAKGIGEKTAADILQRHGTLEAAIAAAMREKPSVRRALLDARGRAAVVQGHRDAARPGPRPAAGPPHGPRGRRGRCRHARHGPAREAAARRGLRPAVSAAARTVSSRSPQRTSGIEAG